MLYYECINFRGYILIPEYHTLFKFNDNIIPGIGIGDQDERLHPSVCRDFVYFGRFLEELFWGAITYAKNIKDFNEEFNLAYEKKYTVLGFDAYNYDFSSIIMSREARIDKCRNIARILDNPIFYDDTISITENIFDKVLSYEDFCKKFKLKLCFREQKNKKVIKIK